MFGIPISSCFSFFQTCFQSKMSDLEGQLSTERTRRMSECEEWRQFQADLLMTVRVANDFQTEAQGSLSCIHIRRALTDQYFTFSVQLRTDI